MYELGIPVVYTAQPGGQTLEQRGLLQDFWGDGIPADRIKRKLLMDLFLMKMIYSQQNGDIVHLKRQIY